MEYSLLGRPIGTDDREWLNLIDKQQTSTQGHKDNFIYIYIYTNLWKLMKPSTLAFLATKKNKNLEYFEDSGFAFSLIIQGWWQSLDV